MTDSGDQPKIHIDSDWKAEAQQEKERLAEQEREHGEHPQGEAPSVLNIVNLLAMQAVVGLGGMQTPSGERLPPDHAAARFHIDLLAVLEEKTKGNLTEEEQKVITATLHELRLMFVQVAGAGAGAKPKA